MRVYVCCSEMSSYLADTSACTYCVFVCVCVCACTIVYYVFEGENDLKLRKHVQVASVCRDAHVHIGVCANLECKAA